MTRALAVAALGGLVPAVAQACPVCAADSTPNAALLIAGMIAAPYVVALLVIRAVRAAGGGP